MGKETEMLIDLVSSVSELISQYGVAAVRDTVEYVSKYSEHNNIRIGDPHTSVYFTISKDQFRSIGDYVRADYKIQAIKLLREITSCALKEAKDVVENTRW
jgi:ribosomal protein L7/L12